MAIARPRAYFSADHAVTYVALLHRVFLLDRPRRFRVKLEQWLDTIRTLWPECPARLTGDGQTLSVGAGSAVKQTDNVVAARIW